jgi:hypothetical protein
MADGFAKAPTVTIDKNVPLPPDLNAKRISCNKFPFSTMEAGDSFLVTDEYEKKCITVKACVYGKKHGKRFCTRKVPDGVRVWRVS